MCRKVDENYYYICLNFTNCIIGAPTDLMIRNNSVKGCTVFLLKKHQLQFSIISFSFMFMAAKFVRFTE